MGFLIRERGDRQGERPDLSGDRRYRRPQLLLVVARVTLHLDESADQRHLAPANGRLLADDTCCRPVWCRVPRFEGGSLSASRGRSSTASRSSRGSRARPGARRTWTCCRCSRGSGPTATPTSWAKPNPCAPARPGCYHHLERNGRVTDTGCPETFMAVSCRKRPLGSPSNFMDRRILSFP